MGFGSNKAGFFGPLKPFTGTYHPSVYARGGGAALGTLGKAFAYKRPQLAQGGNVPGNNVLPRYAKQPVNNASNDPGSSGGQDEDYLRPAQRRAYESHERFRRGGAAKITPAWTDRPYHVKQRLARGSGAPRIHVDHPGSGLVMSIHLSDVGPHAITLGDHGGVDSSRMVQRQAASVIKM
jgi:hypothetical protein